MWTVAPLCIVWNLQKRESARSALPPRQQRADPPVSIPNPESPR
ncbi:MAG: hypothetical protein AVDCRST_MAG68-2574 [uncultured Gemmatimonadetes bacterium]|uniref:Uncharacterized protein n=1 Tax=uncultured Gemmatimonadota bacterium TaxID=203437 RepID=A0A6J4LL77_9BACT|nr:MAG: hypothetical protein AVDCRST_MAG68-2574 [uncultured Gemmatimonadota bacterium]